MMWSRSPKTAESCRNRKGNVSNVYKMYLKTTQKLFVVSKSDNISKAAASIPGIDVCDAKNLSVLNLAPG